MCPSVVSVNKITRAESLIIVTWVSDQPLRNVVFGVTLRLLVTHFIVVSCHDAIKKLGRSPVTSVIYSAWFVAAKFTALAAGTLHSIRSEGSQILAQNRDFCLPHLHSTPPPRWRGGPSEYCHDE